MLYVSPVIIVVGTVGNVLSIIVFCQKGLRVKSTSAFLIGLAVVDTLVLFTGLLRWWISELLSIDIRIFSLVGCKTHIFLTYAAIHCSAWILVAVTIERFISVFLPMKSRQICTRHRAIVSMVAIIVFLTALNAHFFWSYTLNTSAQNVTYCEFDIRYEGFAYMTWPWIDAFVASYIPFAVMLVCNVAIISKLINATLMRKSSMNVGRNVSNKMGTLTAMLLTLNLIFLLTTSPIAIFLAFQEHFEVDTPISKARFELAWYVVLILQHSNSALNFFLYCLSGARFRKEFVALLCRRRVLFRASRITSYVTPVKEANQDRSSTTDNTYKAYMPLFKDNKKKNKY